MLNFKKLGLSDIELVRPYFVYSRSNKCDNSVGGSVMWADFFNTHYTIVDQTCIFKVDFFEKGECFTVPIGLAESHALDLLYEYAKDNNIPLQFVTMTEREMAVIEGKFVIEKELCADWSDYIYDAGDLINLNGRKYHGQKNHINYFIKNNKNYSFELIDEKNTKDCEKFLLEYDENVSKDSELYKAEIKSCFDVLQNNDKYKLYGLLLRIDDRVCAFSMGEKIKNTLYVHIEKADKSIRGAYPMMMNEFAKRYAFDMKYINREDSSGDKGLETSKLQYHPCTILNKYYGKVVGHR